MPEYGPHIYDGIYGFSCVENQVLAVLQTNGFEVSDFYADSGIWLSELFFSWS